MWFIRNRIKSAWSAALFSSVESTSLHRYFQFHLDGLTEMLNSLYKLEERDCYHHFLLEMITYLLQNFASFLDENVPAPLAYRKKIMGTWQNQIRLIKALLHTSGINSDLKSCILGYLKEMTDQKDVEISFFSLHYFQKWLRSIHAVCMENSDLEDSLNRQLLLLNFNHLTYLHYQQVRIRYDRSTGVETLYHLRAAKSKLMALPIDQHLSYHPQWPPVKSMLKEWIDEEIAAVEQDLRISNLSIPNAVARKLPLNISVAQLACLIRMFYEENQLTNTNLTQVFKFFSTNFQTKRQTVISSGSLSKEFYSVDQVTAARVQGLLQKMVTRINRNFFPV